MFGRMEFLAEPPRIVKKSSSFTRLNSSSFPSDNGQEKMANPETDDEWCQVRPNNPDPVNQTLWEHTEGYNVENIYLYLIDMNILSSEQIRWKKVCEKVDFSADPGPIKDLMFELEEKEEQPSTSTQTLNNSNEDFGETSANNSAELQDDDDPSEKVVRALMNYFKNKKDGNFESLTQIPYIDAPENLLQIYSRLPEPPNEFYTVDGQEIRLRNSMGWRPPKKTFIFDLHEIQYDFTTMLVKQGHSCAGCGLKFQKQSPNFCNYYNTLFCRLCFQGQTAKIPAQILHKWNFKEYPVSDIAYRFLTENEDQPVFDIHIIDAALFRKVKNLRLIRSIRIKIAHLWQYIKRCPNTSEFFTKYGPLKTMYEAIPSRFLAMEFGFMYSILDLCAIENGNLIEMLRPLEVCGTAHVTKCNICEQRGFLCQVCIVPDHIIFPFQLEKIFRCDACGSLAHLACYRKRMSKNRVWVCSRCERIRKKRMLQQRPFESSNSD